MTQARAMLRCSFCNKPQSEVGKLVAGPGVYICDEDIRRAGTAPGVERGEIKCSFCGRWRRQADKLVAGLDVFICNGCIEVCTEIIHATSEADAAGGTIAEHALPAAISRGERGPLNPAQRGLVWLARRIGLDVTVRRRPR